MNDDIKRIQVLLPESLYKKVKELANQNKSKGANKGSVSRQIRRILEEAVGVGR